MANGNQSRIRKEFAKIQKRDGGGKPNVAPINHSAHGKKSNVGDVLKRG